MITSDNAGSVNLAPTPGKPVAIRIIGVGGAGCNAVSSMTFDEPGDYIALNTDSQALNQCRVEKKVLLGAKRTRGLSAGGDPEVARCAAEDDWDALRALCSGADLVFVLAGLGGGTGTGAAPVLARAARESGALVLAVAALPFDFEGGRRQRQAQLGLQQLKTEADAVICLPNQKLLKLIDGKSSALECFRISDGLFAQGVLGIRRMLGAAGLINVDLAALRSVTHELHSESSFAIAEAVGEKRADVVLEKILAHPLLDGRVLEESEAVLVSIVSGNDLTMAEVDRVMGQINRRCEAAHVIFGASINPEFANRLSVTLIASGGAAPPPPAPAFIDTRERQVPTLPPVVPELSDPETASRPPRFVAPAPELTPERRDQIISRSTGTRRKKISRLQKELPLEIVSRGRFEKSEPTIRHGEDLDIPTYIRRRVVMN
jgi:cell division protein FtsZ